MSTDDSPDDGPLFDPRITSYNWLVGVLAGAWTFVVSYLAMGAVVLVPDGPGENATARAVLTEVGRLTYSAHQVNLDVQTVKENVVIVSSSMGINSTRIRPGETVIVNTESGSPVTVIGDNIASIHVYNFDKLNNPIAYAESKPELLYYLVPIVVLIAAGAILAWFTLARGQKIAEAVMPGIALTGGYVVTAILGTFFVGRELADGAALLTPNLAQTVVFALVYALVCATIGSLAVGAYRNQDELRRTSDR